MKCRYFETCNAPLCPLDESSLKNSVWYSNEDICKVRNFSKTQLIKNQRKIKRKEINADKYFTYEMLNKKFRITKALEGLNPDKEETVEIKRWLKKHPVLKKRQNGLRGVGLPKKQVPYNGVEDKEGHLEALGK